MQPCKHQRRGATAVQVVVVLAGITITVVLGVTQIGSLSQAQMVRTATDVGNPSSLVGRFGNSTSATGGSGAAANGSGSAGSSSSGDTSSGGADAGGASSSSGSLCP